MEAEKQDAQRMTWVLIREEADRMLFEQMKRLEAIAKKGSIQAELDSQEVITMAMCAIADRFRI